ncbi:hypothetical protein SLEP1_g31529 [Rubroshorea leprosula]|uniref:Integrase catalytic domain-containing protein n=1 Tax=Rubroshorea leprosula TaxID=152421 RepID=A0AAV5K3K9_9ROSI|nr:hypothetical protein SLEP1_g31529 [Rubroshorea leprosula]
MKKRSLAIQSPFQPMKDVEYFSSESNEGEELSLKPSHVSASKLRWADYPSSSSESLLLALVTEATSGDPNALLKAVEGLRKAVAEKDAQIKELQELLAAQHLSKQNNQAASSSVADKALENKEDSLRTSDRGKQVTMEESLELSKPPKFQKFNGKGNPRQHVAHFVETCNNAGTYGDLMVKQFVRSLEDTAFECTKRIVSLPELANTKQKKDESMTDFIERWRNLVLNCREKISEISSIDMCVQGMHWGLLYNLQANMPHTFEELATRAHDLEIQIARHGNFLPTDARDKKESRKDVKKEVKPSKAKEIMAVTTTLVKISQQKLKQNPKQDSEVPTIFEQLLALNLIELRTPKRPEEVGRVNDPKYCKYHRIVSLLIGKCFVLKDLIVCLEKEGKIQLESEEGSAAINVAMVSFGSFSPVPLLPVQPTPLMVQPKEFGPHLPKGAIQVKFQTDDEEKIAYAYPGMPPSGGPSSLSLYDLIMVNLEDWESSSESEDEVGNGWSTFISKSRKHRNPVSSGMSLPDPHKIMYGIYPEIKPTRWFSNSEFPVFYNDDEEPFTKEESHFVDAKFYEKEKDDFEALPIKMPQIKQKNDEKIIVRPIKDPSSSSEVNLSIEDLKVLQEDLVLPLSTLSKLGISNPVIKEMVETAIEHEKQPQGWFDPCAQMLLKRASFKEGESRQLGDLNSILTGPAPSLLTIQENHSQKPLVFSRLGAKQQNSKKTSKSQKVQKNKNKSMQRKKYQWRRKDVLDGQEISKPSVEEVKVVESNHVSIEKIPDSDSSNEEPNPAPKAFEDGGQATTDELKQRNLGIEDDPRPIFLSALLSLEEEVRYVQLFDEYKDVFAWSYKEMPGLDPKVVVHRLAVKHGLRPVKQSQRRFRADLIPQIEAEVDKLIEVGFIRGVHYPSWIVNIVPVSKKNGQLRVCVDFRDLNQASPKDDFSLPIIERMVDATMGHEVLSFMDGFSGYNQIHMDPKDEEITAFQTPKGIYYYKVMPFALKNAGATYQRAMQMIFSDMLHKLVECYVDDLVVKSKRRDEHLNDLKVVFERLRKYQLKMNPLKCAFGVSSRKFLGFIVRHRGIKIDQSKIEAIVNMPPPKKSSRAKKSPSQAGLHSEAIKGQALADFLADHPIPAEWELSKDLPNEEMFFVDVLPSWELYFDGASRRDGAGVRVVFVMPKNEVIPFSFALREQCSNNVAEYQALIASLEMALEMQIYQLNVYGDSSLFGPKLHYQIRRMGYYWPTMVKDCMEYAKKCEACQFHANFIHQPPKPLHPTIASWPFHAWGLDVIGPITPKSSAGHAYILVATDYFSKWAEAVPLREVKKENVVDFIRVNIIYRYGVPRYIITDNGKPFSNSLMDKLCSKFKFAQHFSSMYNAVANGLAKAFNKTLCNLLKKVVSKSKPDWHERIGEALWANQTTHRTPTKATLYSLVYGVEAVLPLECQIPSLKIAIQEGLIDEQNAKLCLLELEALDEKRLETQQHLECYQARLSRAFNKKVRLRAFQVGDVVLAVRRPIVITRHSRGKFTSKWDGLYIVIEVYSNGAYNIVDKDGLQIGPINGKFLKKFYS